MLYFSYGSLNALSTVITNLADRLTTKAQVDKVISLNMSTCSVIHSFSTLLASTTYYI